MKLEDVIPESPVVTLSTLKKSYELRLPTLEDKAHWLKQYGGEAGLNAVFRNQEWIEICKIAFRLMKDKTDWMPAEEQEIDDFGETRKVLVLSPMRLFRSLQNTEDGIALIRAITAAMLLSEPLARPLVAAEFEKKSESLGLNSTGETSSNSSQPSTRTPPSNSETSPIGSSPS